MKNERTLDSSLNIADIVLKLKQLRDASLQERKRLGNPPKLPSRKVLANVIENIAAALFPHRLGGNSITDESIDFYVGSVLDKALRELLAQVKLELLFYANLEQISSIQEQQAQTILRQFSLCLPDIRAVLDSDIQAAYEGDPAARQPDEVLVCYPGIQAIIHYRVAHELFKLGLPLIARIISEIAHSSTGIDIHPGASIGSSFFIDHGTGVVIGETSIIGKQVRIYQAVTLGAKSFPTDQSGHLIKGNQRHPIVEDGVVIYAGATILGRVTIGHHSVIGGNVWLTKSVPPHSNITQASMVNRANPQDDSNYSIQKTH